MLMSLCFAYVMQKSPKDYLIFAICNEDSDSMIKITSGKLVAAYILSWKSSNLILSMN